MEFRDWLVSSNTSLNGVILIRCLRWSLSLRYSFPFLSSHHQFSREKQLWHLRREGREVAAKSGDVFEKELIFKVFDTQKRCKNRCSDSYRHCGGPTIKGQGQKFTGRIRRIRCCISMSGKGNSAGEKGIGRGDDYGIQCQSGWGKWRSYWSLYGMFYVVTFFGFVF